MEDSFIFQVGKGDFLGEVFGEIFGVFLELLAKFTIKLLFRSSECDLSCEQTVKTWIVILFVWALIIAAFFIFRTTKRRRKKKK